MNVIHFSWHTPEVNENERVPMDAKPPYPGIGVESAVQCLAGIREPKIHVRRQMQGYLGETSHFGRNVGKCNLLGTNVQNGLSIAVWTR